jgi:hypothetical protein
MSSPLDSYAEYSRLIFSLLADRLSIESHTLTIYTASQTVGITRGEIVFRRGYTLTVFEQIDFVAHTILKYFYELDQGKERLWWYDPMPHPNVPELQSTHPHHKHIPPDIKHHRIPAPGLSFAEPNLPKLIDEVEAMIKDS